MPTEPKADSDSSRSQIVSIAFVRERPSNVKNLAGFKKHHRVPDSGSGNAASFIAELAGPDIDEDLESRFRSLRTAFRFKRADVVVSNSGDGNGSITPPYLSLIHI